MFHVEQRSAWTTILKPEHSSAHTPSMYKNTLNNILETGKSAFYSAVDYVKDTGMKLGLVAALALPVIAAQPTTQPAKKLHTQPVTYGIESCIDPFTEMSSPISPTGTVPKPGTDYGNFTTSFQKHGSTHRFIGTTGGTAAPLHNGYLLEYDGLTFTGTAVPLDMFGSGLLQGGAQTIEGYILGAGTDLFEGKIVDGIWQNTRTIPLSTSNNVMGVATFFYLNDAVEMKDASNNSVGYAVFVALSNNEGVKRVVNTSGQLVAIGSSASTYYSLGSVELDSSYCDLDKRMIAMGNDNKVVFKKMRADGTINGMGVMDVVINIGSYVHGFNFGSGEFTAEIRIAGARYNPFTWQSHMLPIPSLPDADNDGVADKYDKCSNTVPNATVVTDLESTLAGCPTPDSPFDRDDDGDIDHIDFELWEALASGPGIPSDPSADYDGDGDADQVEVGLQQAATTGENVPFNPKSP